MAWTNASFVGIRDVAVTTTYYFAPNEMIYTGKPVATPRQKIAKAESGIQKVCETGQDELLYEFFINKMPNSSRGYTGGLTIHGYSNLAVMIQGFGDYALNTIQIKLPDTSTWITVRFNGPYPFMVPKVSSIGSVDRYGDGSTAIQFRKELT